MTEPYPPGIPLFSRETYERWIAENRGTPAQRERYRDALDWYKENENDPKQPKQPEKLEF